MRKWPQAGWRRPTGYTQLGTDPPPRPEHVDSQDLWVTEGLTEARRTLRGPRSTRGALAALGPWPRGAQEPRSTRCTRRLPRRRACSHVSRGSRGDARAPTCRASAEETRGSRGDARAPTCRASAEETRGPAAPWAHGPGACAGGPGALRSPAARAARGGSRVDWRPPKVRRPLVRSLVGHQKCKSTCTCVWGGGLYLYSAMRQPPRIIAALASPRSHRRARIVIVVVIVVIVSITMI